MTSLKLNNKIGVIVDSLRLPLREGLKAVKEMGADGVQIYAVNGEMAPENLSGQSRKELKSYLESLGLEISALCGDLGGHGFQDQQQNKQKVEKSKRILDLAVELGTNIVTTHIGIIPEEKDSPIFEAMQSACEELGVYAKRMNAYFAIETGPEHAVRLKDFLDSLSTNGVSVNFDPANMVMVTGDDPVEGVKLLKDYIVHTHVKDGIRLKPVDPRDVYGALGYGGGTDHEKIAQMVASGEYFRELQLGKGAVDFPKYFAALQEIQYNGYLTIEREVQTNPTQDISEAIEFIKAFKVD
ncbi:sugar phosphate isomerase/epimerase [Bacillus salipaludis]|uniref:Sugar phosphate isomerase/epimerase n=1 Tax=Bacillus salipaludis TaxID=2547811 RepID=A0A4R5VU14_9BACI|nr:sugar phosphate isomerase/epimerase family protein [Bacillus salipaludis]MDQ6600495.1 sugar phosphate isomerase/epimerase family protein [Bacillus salipaludis]TDK62113.1 sugar phosphate isomerase/epimerase [Bacillus salipaludis]